MNDTTADPAPTPDPLTVDAEPSPAQKVAAETIGTFILVFFGCGAAVMSGGDYVGTALAFGLSLLVAIYALGRITGGHFNPAVSVGAALSGRVAWNQLPIYIAGQLLGAILAGFALFVLMHGFEGYDATGNMGQNFFGDVGTGYAVWAALLLEILLTAIFVGVILAVTDARYQHPALAPLAIGIALVGVHLVAIPATGTSVNPARSIGPALFAGGDAILQLWLFILAPLVGAAIVGVVYPLVFGQAEEPVPGSGLSFARPRVAGTVGGAPDEYQQQWNQPGARAAVDEGGAGHAGAQQQYSSEPIIQDGWQWDPQAQQWIPAQQGSYAPGQQGTGQGSSPGSSQGTGQPGRYAAGGTGQPGTGQPGASGQPGGATPTRGEGEEWPEDGATHVKGD